MVSRAFGIVVLFTVSEMAFGVEAVTASAGSVVIETDYLRYAIGADGRNAAFVDKTSGMDWCDQTAAPFFAHVTKAGRQYDSTKATISGDLLTVNFGETGIQVVFALRKEAHYFTLEVRQVSDDTIDELTFANAALKLKGKLAEPFAACALALNLQTNVPQIPGLNSGMQATCYARFGLVGSKVAIAAAPQAVFRDVLKEVVSAAPDLPHSPLGGPWALDAAINRGSYLIDTDGQIGTKTVESWIALAKNLGVTQIDFHTGKSLRFGDLLPNPALYPKGLSDVKDVIARLHAAGISAGLHTYAFFIAKNTPWVTPAPDPRLAVDARFTLAQALAEDGGTMLTQESPKGMSAVTGFQIRNSVTLRVDDELVTYTGVSVDEPFGFTGCQRGAWGTKRSAHAAGAKVTHLKECFGLFVPDGDSTLFSEVAAKTAQVYNDCGFDMIYLDALDGSDIVAGGPYAWRYGSKFVFELAKRLDRPALFEMSTLSHHLWFVRSRMGAWDVPPRAAKRFVDMHAIVNRNCGPMFLPANLGWWGVFDWDGVQPERTFPDTIDYLCCKGIGTNSGLSFLVGFTPESYAKSANIQRLGALIKRYEDLRRSGAVSDDVKARLSALGDEFALKKGADGSERFRPMRYDAHRIEGLRPDGETWTSRNRFGGQRVQLRIEAMMSVAPYEDPSSTVIEDFKDTAKYSERSTQSGVTGTLETVDVKSGAVAEGRFTATNAQGTRESAWSLVGRRYTPPLNIAGRGLGVWVEGDGQGEVLNFQVKSPESLGGGFQDHYVDVNFSGRRYFELVEPESDRVAQYNWPYTSWQEEWETKGVNVGNVYKSFVTWTDTGHIETLTIGCINLPIGKTVDCRIGPIKSLPAKTATIVNPTISVGGASLMFPVSLESGSYLEFRSAEDCHVFDAKGEPIGAVAPVGSAPILAPGDNLVRFSGDTAKDGPRPRLRVTVISSGDPFDAGASGPALPVPPAAASQKRP